MKKIWNKIIWNMATVVIFGLIAWFFPFEIYHSIRYEMASKYHPEKYDKCYYCKEWEAHKHMIYYKEKWICDTCWGQIAQFKQANPEWRFE